MSSGGSNKYPTEKKMFIILTNASEQHKGNKIAIRSDLIVSIHSKFITQQDTGVIENITYVFCPPHGTWEVSEHMEDIVQEISQDNK